MHPPEIPSPSPQIFSMTVFFGLFHGLLFLPAILMMFGSTKLEGPKKSDGSDGSSPPEASTVDSSVEASPHLGTVNGGFSHGEEVRMRHTDYRVQELPQIHKGVFT